MLQALQHSHFSMKAVNFIRLFVMVVPVCQSSFVLNKLTN